MDTVVVALGDVEWTVHKGQLLSCSPVFTSMFSGPYKEADEGRLEIVDDGTPHEVMSDFLDLIEFPRNRHKRFSDIAAGLRLGPLLVLLDRYDTGTSLLPLIVDLIEAKPTLKNIEACEELIRRSEIEIKWSVGIIDYLIAKCLRFKLSGVSASGKVPFAEENALQAMRKATLVAMLARVNSAEYTEPYTPATRCIKTNGHVMFKVKFYERSI